MFKDNLRNSNLTEHVIRKNTGEIDYNKELKALRKEKKRLRL